MAEVITMQRAFQLTLWCLLASSAGAQSGVCLLEGLPGGAGDVRSYDAATGALLAAPPELAGVQLLPIEACGRTALEEFLPGRARRIDDIAGASRLRLPQDRGSLYRFARASGTSRTFGYFQVERDGTPRLLLERAGVGALGDADPFLQRVAVAPDGRAFLCATRSVAGGDLLEVRFGTGVEVVDRTSNAPPLRFSARGLALAGAQGFAVSGRGVLRFTRATNDTATLVTFSAATAPTFFSGEITLSPGGQAAAFTAGDGPGALHAWAVGSDGVARCASQQAGALSGAGGAADGPDGPFLAVTDDAQWCAWRTEGATRECFVARPAAPASEAPEQLSSDARFLDTLDEVAVFFFRGPTELLFAVGERPALPDVGIEKLDVFRAQLAPGTPPVFQNLSLSSGDATVPFLSVPQLKPTRIVLTPDRQSLLLHDRQSGSGALLAVEGVTSGVITLLPEVKDLDWVELAGRRFALGLQRADGARPHEVRTIAADLSDALLLTATSTDLEPTRSPAARADGWIAWVLASAAGESLLRVRLPGTAVETWAGSGPFSGPAWTSGGAVAFGTPGSAWTWNLGTPSALAIPIAAPFQILPGA